MNASILFFIGLVAGAMITVQSVLNSALGARTGNFGSVLILTIVSIVLLAGLIVLFPGTADFKGIPGVSEWYLYVGGLLGVVILAAPIFLVPRIGATSTLTALVIGQLALALLIDQFGLFGFPRIDISLARAAGLALLVAGAFLIQQ